MKSLFVLVAIVMSLSLAKNRTSDEVVLTAWPQGQHFYLGEPIVLTCEVKRNSSELWIYSWFRHDLGKALTPGRAHRVSHHTYSISVLTSEDSGTYWCKAWKQDTNSTLLSKPVSLSVTAASPPASLEVWPDSSQHLKDEKFSLHCLVHGGQSGGWTLRRLYDAKVNSGCLKIEGIVNPDQTEKCSFNNITGGLSGLYWCGAARGDQRSNTINIIVTDDHVILQSPVQPVTEGETVTLTCKTSNNLYHALIYKDGVSMNNANVTIENVTKSYEGFYKCVDPTAAVESPENWLSVRDNSEEKNSFVAAWVWVVCVIVIILLLIPVTFLLVPSLRRRVKLFPRCRETNAHQEMPKTKQDVTEIQWDLGWMEMTNLLDNVPYTGI
ncbi:Fc receptor-like protein 5 [Tachysurus fulvidraco]|uniref:Fc receptor-like protein 5 n=1 Tax=Tachysurus fulvidraco TaxID=1234273 RepID=UPI000F50010B|nr:Fc receptor-like protein 5 [Tachysurus fulvidraco]